MSGNFIVRQRAGAAKASAAGRARGGSPSSSSASVAPPPSQVEFDPSADHSHLFPIDEEANEDEGGEGEGEGDELEGGAGSLSAAGSVAGSKRGRDDDEASLHFGLDEDAAFQKLVDKHVAAHRLPPEFPKAMRILFAFFSENELGMAELYARHFKGHIKTCGKDTVWRFDPTDCLWKTVSYAKWTLSLGKHLFDQVRPVVERLAIEVKTALAHGDKEAAKPPQAWLKRMEKAHDRISSAAGMRETASLAFRNEMLHDEDFVQTLDANPLLYSFRDSVVELKWCEDSERYKMYQGPRTAEHLLSYALPFDFEDADPGKRAYYQRLMTRFIHNLYEDEASELAMHATLGYFSTGLRNEKRIWTIYAKSDSGKTTLLNIVGNAMCKYANIGGVPVDEILEDCKFSGKLAAALAQNPRIRIEAFDECRKKIGGLFCLNEDIINNLGNGKIEGTKVSLNIKHGEAISIAEPHVKLVLMINSPVTVPPQSTGLANRITNIGLQFTFPKIYNPLTSGEMARPRDVELEKALMSSEARAGIMRYLMRGALRYLNKEPLMSPRMERSTFLTLVKGDPYLEWLTTQFFPTGVATDMITVEGLVENFKAAGHASILANNALVNLRAIVEGFADFATFKQVADQFGRLSTGITGIRGRLVGDPEWYEARIVAARVHTEAVAAAAAAAAPMVD